MYSTIMFLTAFTYSPKKKNKTAFISTFKSWHAYREQGKETDYKMHVLQICAKTI